MTEDFARCEHCGHRQDKTGNHRIVSTSEISPFGGFVCGVIMIVSYSPYRKVCGCPEKKQEVIA